MYSIGIEIIQSISRNIGVILIVTLVSLIASTLFIMKNIETKSYFKGIRKHSKLIINCLLVISFTSSTIYVGFKYYQYYKDSRSYSKVRAFAPSEEIESGTRTNEVAEGSEEETSSELVSKELNINEEKLTELNSDYKLWIKINDSDISYPVVQGKDNEEYLHSNFNKEKSSAGAIFVDYRNDINKDKNIILYGHNMKDGSMFNKINKFKEKEAFDKGTIKIVKDDREYIYDVFSVFIEDENYQVFRNNFEAEEDYKTYIKHIQEKSIYKKRIEENYNNIITLYTCSYEFNDARTIVYGILRN